jgi:hypothetical protein
VGLPPRAGSELGEFQVNVRAMQDIAAALCDVQRFLGQLLRTHPETVLRMKK